MSKLWKDIFSIKFCTISQGWGVGAAHQRIRSRERVFQHLYRGIARWVVRLLDKKIGKSDRMAKGTKENRADYLEVKGKPTGRSDLGLHCIGEICFTEDGFIVKLPKDANPECAKRTAELILRGNSNVVFEVPGKGIVKDPTRLED